MGLPSFTEPVPDNGYRWWYLDAVSDDGVHALTAIVFIGSVFSPYYAWARQRGAQPALQHCAVNVALYGPVSRWAMTERTQNAVVASADALRIGNSVLAIERQQLVLDVDEFTMPIPGRLRGRLSVELVPVDFQPHTLDSPEIGPSLHHWQPVAPQTRITVNMSSPSLHWQGAAYVDSNYGAAPLESSFKSWTWSRSHEPDDKTTILYDVLERNGRSSRKSLQFDNDGNLSEVLAPEHHTLRPTRYWRIPRSARTPAGTQLQQVHTLEDTPFYSRTRFIEQHRTHAQVTVHESLDLERFDSAWVRCLLPFRMPRSTRTVKTVDHRYHKE
jgi:carotenoid 1,2-hydratase